MNKKKLPRVIIPLCLFLLFALLTSYVRREDALRNLPKAGAQFAPRAEKPMFPERKSTFLIDAFFLPGRKLLEVNETIVWTNEGTAPVSSIYLHLYPNAYKSSNTIFASGNSIPASSVTSIEIDSLSVNGRPAALRYTNTDIYNPSDSTVGVIDLPQALPPGASVRIASSYRIPIPKAYGRMGYAAGEEFYFFAQWFLKPGVFNGEKWICSPFLPNAEFFSSFADYEVRITAPKEFSVFGTGKNTRTVIAGPGLLKHIFKARSVHDFAWSAIKNAASETYILPGSGKDVRVIVAAPAELKSSLPRYKAVLNEAYTFCRGKIGEFPYSTFTLVIAPARSGGIASMEYPCLSVVAAPYPENPYSLATEELVVHEYIHQYFYGAVRTNESCEAWMDEGLTEYLTALALQNTSRQKISSFPWFKGFFAKGMELLRLGEIPLVYSLAAIKVPYEAEALEDYYKYLHVGRLADSSYLFTDGEMYQAVTYGKGELFFKGLEGIIGKGALLQCLRAYYKENTFRYPSARDLFKVIQRYSKRDLDWYFDTYYKEAAYCDYSVENISRVSGTDDYSVIIRQNGTANFPCEVALYTSRGILRAQITTFKTIQSVRFHTNAEVLGAEVDPGRKNIYDINFANNSRMLDPQLSSVLYLSLRWFFWMQSFLLSFGSMA